MNYLMTGIELHLDKGFGITADSYFESAEFLKTSNKHNSTSSTSTKLSIPALH